MTIEKEIEMFGNITAHLCQTFEKKRKTYGQTTTETYEKFGPVSMLTRMHDKLGRLDNLLARNATNQVPNESIEDTILDLAVYCIIFMIERAKCCLPVANLATDIRPCGE